MERRSFSYVLSDQADVRSLKSEISHLKGVILQITDESQKQINELKSKIARYESGSLYKSPTKNEKQLLDEIEQLKRSKQEENTKINTDWQKEISELRYEIAELKNSTAQAESINAQLTVENLALKTKLHQIRDELADKHIELMAYTNYSDDGENKFIQNQLESNQKLINKINRARKNQESFIRKFLNMKENLQYGNRDLNDIKQIVDRAEKTVEYLTAALLLVSDVPQSTTPDPLILIENPDILIDFVDGVESSSRYYKNNLQNDVIEATKTLSSTMVKAQQPPLSRPVARVLSNLGAVIIDVAEQMNEDHKQTMQLLEFNGELSDDLLNNSDY